jgi:uncharacterized protein (TIGR02001 family)
MKKIIATLSALAAFSFASAQELSVSTTFGYESEYIFRGVQFAEEIFTPALDFSVGGAYLGFWAALPAKEADGNELDVYAGYGMALGDVLSLDVGATYYTFPDSEDDFFDTDVNSLEFYVGISADVMGAPSAYIYYDVDLEVLTGEVSGGHSIDIADNTSLDLSAFLGFVSPDEGDDYTYYGASVDLGYSFTDAASAALGVRWSGASEDYMYDGDSNTFWYGFAVTAGF